MTDSWDNLHSQSPPGLYWTTSNFGEAIPGVSTPLNWSLWGPALEGAMRGSVFAIGGMTRAERDLPLSLDDWYARSFFGRPAMNIQFLATVGDRMPGTTGQAVVRDLMGHVPPDMTFKHTSRRYPVIAWRLLWIFLAIPKTTRRHAAKTTDWWQLKVTQVPAMDRVDVIKTLGDAVEGFEFTVMLQAKLLLGSISPLYDALVALTKKTGVGDTASLSGFGGAEMAVVGDIWRASRGELQIDDLLRNHGFHGPAEGELSSTVWREDASPLKKLIADYAARDESADPRKHGERQRQAATTVERKLLDAIPFLQRPFVWLLLILAAQRIPMRGIPKRAFLQLFDVIRICARRLSDILVAEGKLDATDDVFYLTTKELLGEWPVDAKTLVIKRRARRESYLKVNVPADWQGQPEPVPASIQTNTTDQARVARIEGIGVSPGVVEGRARVLLNPDFEPVEAGEILVTPTTDPSWSSVMFISAGLVVDIGGALSHAAVVARELGLPCVVNTRTGSQALRTGDLLRMDGATGRVEVLAHAVRVAMPEYINAPGLASVLSTDSRLLAALQTVRMKGSATSAEVMTATGCSDSGAADSLANLTSAGLTLETKGRYRLTPQGKAQLSAWLLTERARVDGVALTALYDKFHPFNTEFKQLASTWQLRHGEPNDHADTAYDGQILEHLAALHTRFAPLVDHAAALAPRLSAYPMRLVAALARVQAGKHSFFLGPIIDSYHTVWFELHEDLIGLVGRSRETEALAGRAE